MRHWLAVGILISLFASLPLAHAAESLDDTIAFLLQKIATADAAFIRNGKSYPAKEGLEHVRAKYEHFKKEIKTPEDFIRLSATKSLLSGQPYRVRFSDGREMKVGDWLTDELKQHRASNP